MTTQTHTPADIQKHASPAAAAKTPALTDPAPAAGADGRGATTVADGVVAKIAGIAIQEIEGVHALGGGAARALGTLREKVGQKDLTQGVSVEVGPNHPPPRPPGNPFLAGRRVRPHRRRRNLALAGLRGRAGAASTKARSWPAPTGWAAGSPGCRPTPPGRAGGGRLRPGSPWPGAVRGRSDARPPGPARRAQRPKRRRGR